MTPPAAEYSSRRSPSASDAKPAPQSGSVLKRTVDSCAEISDSASVSTIRIRCSSMVRWR